MKKALNRFLNKLCTIVLVCHLSTGAFAVEQAKLLSEELAGEALVWLNAGGKKFIGLWEQDASGTSFGVVLILHGYGQTADWPDSVNPMRTSLIQFGWSTMSIELPEPEPNKDKSAQIQARIQAAIKFLETKGQLNVILAGVSEGARCAVDFIAQQPAKSRQSKDGSIITTHGSIRALIMVSARDVQVSKNFRLPTLDVFYGEHFLDQTEVEQRGSLAKKYRLPHYHQIGLLRPEATKAGKENRLTRRVRGFLNKYAKGVEVKRK